VGTSKRPQAEHNRNLKKSQHDKRERFNRPNPQRKRTTKARVPLAGAMQTAVLVLQAVLDRRIAFRPIRYKWRSLLPECFWPTIVVRPVAGSSLQECRTIGIGRS